MDETKGNKNETETLQDLLTHIRNAAAHGRFLFLPNTDPRQLEEIWIVVEDRPSKKSKTDWRAVIKGNELFDLCIRLPDHVEDYTK